MKNWRVNLLAICALLSGCASTEFNKAATDVALTSTGGVIGYQVSHGKPAGTAAGAAAGFLISKVAESSYEHSVSESEKKGYDKAMNQTVKEQYWIIQNQQKTLGTDEMAHLTPILVPETKINGVIVNAHFEYYP